MVHACEGEKRGKEKKKEKRKRKGRERRSGTLVPLRMVGRR